MASDKELIHRVIESNIKISASIASLKDVQKEIADNTSVMKEVVSSLNDGLHENTATINDLKNGCHVICATEKEKLYKAIAIVMALLVLVLASERVAPHLMKLFI